MANAPFAFCNWAFDPRALLQCVDSSEVVGLNAISSLVLELKAGRPVTLDLPYLLLLLLTTVCAKREASRLSLRIL